MKKYNKITKARKLLNLSEQATMEEIKASYRSLLMRWHPDVCNESREECARMTAKIIAAYRTIADYCSHYKFSFSKEEVAEHLSEEDWWVERFGQDPVWGKQ